MSITLEGVRVEVQGFYLKDVSFKVEKGKCLVIVGPSGAGKTLLLDTIAGVYIPKKGSILLEGRDITRARPEERNVGYLPQNLALFPHLSVLENILFGARARRIPLDKAQARVKELAELLRIEHLLNRPSPLTLSGGEKQRVALARALLVEPSVILLDEPFSALDNFIKREFTLYLKEVFSTLESTVIHVTHDLQEAFLLADILGVMLEGKLEQVGTREEICYRPATLGVARLFTGSNIFHGQVIENKSGAVVAKTFQGLTLELPSKGDFRIGQRVVFGISPREIMIIRPGRPLRAKVQVNVFPARVTSVLEGYGSHLVFLNLEGSGEKAEMEVPTYVFRELNINPGSRVQVCLKKDYLWILPAD